MKQSTSGVGYALGAYILWGFFPAYWKMLDHVDAVEILAHRMTWSLVFVLVLLGAQGNWRWWRAVRENKKLLAICFASAGFIAFNWGLYIWAVTNGFIVQTALGYFINPLFNIALGAVFLGERPRRIQKLSIACAAVGVIYLTVAFGEVPWIALLLAGSFGMYGLLKKKVDLGALEGLTVETLLLFPCAAFYVVWLAARGEGAIGTVDFSTTFLLVFSGVATALPLLFFAGAVKRLTLTTVGLIQYLAPTIQFLLGVYVYDEPFSDDTLIGFLFIWTALIMFSAESYIYSKAQRAEVTSAL